MKPGRMGPARKGNIHGTQTLEGVATETENAPEMVKVLVEKRDGRVVDF